MSGIPDPWEAAADRWWDGARRGAWEEAVKRNRIDDLDWDVVLSPQWVPDRGERKMPSLWAVASYWAQRGDWFDVDLSWPRCFACGLDGGHRKRERDLEGRWLTARRLQRGHVVNWARDGLDQVQNLVPLCWYCNRYMPVFGVEHGEDAVAWICSGGAPGEIEARLMAKGMPWAQAGLAYFQILDRHGGSALTPGQRSAAEHFYRRLMVTRGVVAPARPPVPRQLSFDDLMA